MKLDIYSNPKADTDKIKRDVDRGSTVESNGTQGNSAAQAPSEAREESGVSESQPAEAPRLPDEAQNGTPQQGKHLFVCLKCPVEGLLSICQPT